MTSTIAQPPRVESVGTLEVVVFRHPQGCRSYLLADPGSGEALALDTHLDRVDDVAEVLEERGWTLRWVVDSHTHADHPSGAGALVAARGGTRVAHESARHAGVEHPVAERERLALGASAVELRHAPGHTPDHLVLLADGALFSGDTLLIGGVARTDFLGGDAGQLFDTLQALLDELPGDTRLYPGHDYQGREHSTLADERRDNPWLAIDDRARFAQALAADPPPRPANMDDLLRLNREGVQIPEEVSAAEAVEHVRRGGASSLLDVRTGAEVAGEHVAGSVAIPLDQLARRLEDVAALPAPRLLLCQSGARAVQARKQLAEAGLAGLSVVTGGLQAFRAAGGETVRGGSVMSLERQVRIAAGTLVLTGVVLGVAVHPGFLGLAGFVGAGLVFAGLTDWCGMGLLLARAPWNRGGDGPAASAGGTCAASAPAACSAGAPPPACSAGAPPPQE